MTARPDTDVGRLGRLNSLLDTALTLPAESRQDWLASLAGDDASFIATLRTLLQRADVDTDDFLRKPVDLGAGDVDAVPDLAGDLIGPYRLLGVLGRGGMATVWLAERVGDGVQRQVALKLPSVGWGTASLGPRMARERDILAALEHRHIARLYEAGMTPQGRPWLAMERVDGAPLDVHCREHALDVPQRLRLFLQVAEAVAYAHARLVVHRDLKPANILVTSDGQARLLDFGVAKLLQDDDAAGPQLTRLIGRAVTPDYASPEQVSGKPVTVATDVYSLGVVLYELLSGQRPYALGHVSIAALEEAILAADVPLASSRAGLDRRRAAQLRGDLDTILAKALRKDPAKRYSSVEAMAADIQRHLDGEAVLAQRPSRRYRTGKFVRRHWRAAASLGFAMLALGMGLGVAAWQAREARLQTRMAIAQLERTEAALEFSSAVLTEGVGRDERVSLDDLLQRSKDFVTRTANPVARAVSADTLAEWYLSYANYAAAEPLLAQALAEFPSEHDKALTGRMRCRHAHALAKLGRKDEADAVLAAVIAEPDQTIATIAGCLWTRAMLARDDNQAEAAERFAVDGLRRLERSPLSRPMDRAVLLGELAYAHSLQGRSDLADQEFAQSLSAYQALGRGESPTALTLRNNWGIAMLHAGNPLQALPRFEEALAITQRRSPTGLAPSYLLGNHANALRSVGRYADALAQFQQMRRAAQQQGGDRSSESYALIGQANCHFRLGHFDTAQSVLDEARALLPPALRGSSTPAGGALTLNQARIWAARGQAGPARELLTAMIDSAQARGEKGLTLALAHLGRADIAVAQQRPADALVDASAALQISTEVQRQGQTSSGVGQAALALAKLHWQAGRQTEARAMLAQALHHLAPSAGELHPMTIEARALARDMH